jgi:hypothetical protein
MEISNRYQLSSKPAAAPGVVSAAINREVKSIGGNALAPTLSDCGQIMQGQTPRHT